MLEHLRNDSVAAAFRGDEVLVRVEFQEHILLVMMVESNTMVLKILSQGGARFSPGFAQYSR